MDLDKRGIVLKLR